jgi:hypothetical protein
MNHKRRRAKHQRAGCLLCKPHKRVKLARGRRAKALMLVERGLRVVDRVAAVEHDASDEALEDWMERMERSGGQEQ